ncbi:apolipoprotein L3-like [Saccostrea cucullata]|uniref:apolipoprotein L3-like n=1 Tax=Saccostrea cuccullata TaxID=36930 RepID=UPI002ED5B7BE
MEDSFRKARNHFATWAPERLRVLEELRTIRDEIQEQARIQSIGNITYSSVGLIGGGLAIAGIVTAPFTFGTSLALTVAGVATGVTSGVAGVTHGVVKIGIVKKQCNQAKASLEKHDTTCKEMKRLVTLLQKDIEKCMRDGNALKISQVGQGVKQAGSAAILGKGIYKLLDDIFPSAMKNVSKGVTKLSTEALSALAAVGIIIDLGSLIWNAVDMSKIEKGQLCAEAEKLQKVIEQMQHEYDVLKECFC